MSKPLQSLKSLARRINHYLHYRFASRALVLLYHRVAELPSDPQLLCVKPHHFAEQLEVLRRYTRPMSLQELVSALKEDRLPRRAVVLTFDDGYTDNLYDARPLLERFDVPATFFVTTGRLGCQEEYWWDELERLILLPGSLPKELTLTANGRTFHWLDEELADFRDGDRFPDLNWHIEMNHDPSQRHKLYRSIYQFFHALPEREKQKALEQLQTWAGKGATGRPTHRTLSVNDVIQLAKGGLIEIGAHTVSHAMLGEQPPVVQRAEIAGSKKQLEDILGRSVQSFAYPHGSYTQETLAIIQREGFSRACSSDTDAVWRGANLFQLPRVSMRDWDGEKFTRWLKGWMG